MICDCSDLTKKRTLLDGIKSLAGELHVYIINDEKYLRECCFKLLIPSLYNFINKAWFLKSQMIVFPDNSIITIYKISENILTVLMPYTTIDFEVIEHSSKFKLLPDEHTRMNNALTSAYQSIIKLEKNLKNMSYKFSSISFDNETLIARIDSIDLEKGSTQVTNDEENELLKQQTDRIDPAKINNKQCIQCQTFAIIKDDLKLLRHENHEKIALVQYEHEIAKRKIGELRDNLDILQENNIRLKEENKLLRATSTLYANSYDDVD